MSADNASGMQSWPAATSYSRKRHNSAGDGDTTAVNLGRERKRAQIFAADRYLSVNQANIDDHNAAGPVGERSTPPPGSTAARLQSNSDTKDSKTGSYGGDVRQMPPSDTTWSGLDLQATPNAREDTITVAKADLQLLFDLQQQQNEGRERRRRLTDRITAEETELGRLIIEAERYQTAVARRTATIREDKSAVQREKERDVEIEYELAAVRRRLAGASSIKLNDDASLAMDTCSLDDPDRR